MIAPPKGLPAFYSVPQPLPTAIGKLVKSQKIAAPGLDGTMYRVMYVSESVSNQAGRRHRCDRGAEGCAARRRVPGRDVGTRHERHGRRVRAVVVAGLGRAGSERAARPGLGRDRERLPGRGHARTACRTSRVSSAARNTIDIVRAARQLPAAHASNRYVVWGHSEGGQTAMFALHIGAAYAPELRLQGVVAGAPPSQFALVYTFLKTSPYRYYLLMAAGGLNAAYGNTAAPLGQVLTPLGLKHVADLDKGCTGYLVQQLDNIPTTSLVKADPFSVPAWKKVLEANDPQNFTTPSAAPLLIIQGGSDEQIPVVSTQILAKHMCNIGQDLERWIYPGQSHAGVIGPSAPDMIHWIADRFAGVANPDPYTPTGLPGIGITVCPS